jgi:hypothetical protein
MVGLRCPTFIFNYNNYDKAKHYRIRREGSLDDANGKDRE